MRYEVIESRVWKRDDGLTASIYGSTPWTNSGEQDQWKKVTMGWTVRDNARGTIGIGRKPWKLREDAENWVARANSRSVTH